MKAKTKKKFERVVMALLVLVFVLGWTLLLYLPSGSSTPTAPPVGPSAGGQAPAQGGVVQTAAPGP